MFETIVRLTDEQEQLLRKPRELWKAKDYGDILNLRSSLVAQARDALKLYDELVAEAKAKSDD